jgi:DNA modification methylase
MAANKLFYGDNLDVLREHTASASVDLVYLDPPFNSNRGYNVIFAQHGIDRLTTRRRSKPSMTPGDGHRSPSSNTGATSPASYRSELLTL